MSVIRILPRFRQAYRELETLEQREHWSRTEIESFQLERLNAVWQHAICHVPYYQKLAATGLPPRFASLEEFQTTVPLLHKSVIRNDRNEVLSQKAGKGYWKGTSGSTGIPTVVFWGKDAHHEMLRVKYRSYHQWGVDIFDPTVFLWGHYGSLTPGLAGRIARLRLPWEDRLRNRLRLSAYDLSQATLRKYLGQIDEFRPTALYGYSTAAHFLREAEAIGFRSESLKLITLTSEPAFPRIVESVEKAFGVPAVVEYGSMESGVIASEATDRTLRVREDVMLVETLPHTDGQYDIVVSILNNPSFPLLRYAIGDITDAPIERPEHGFSILHNIAGRNNDVIVSRTGQMIHPVWLLHVFDNRSEGTRRWQIQQDLDGRVAVVLERKHPGIAVDTSELEHLMRNRLEGYPITFEVVDHLPVRAGGKHRWVMSDLAASLHR